MTQNKCVFSENHRYLYYIMSICKRCKKMRGLAKGYIICFDCLIELDINHKNYKKYKQLK